MSTTAIKISSVIGEVFAQFGWEHYDDFGKVLGAWNEAVGEQVAINCAPEGLHNNLLICLTRNAIWKNELIYLKPTLMARLNEVLGEPLIFDIDFKVSSGRFMAQMKRDYISFQPVRPNDP